MKIDKQKKVTLGSILVAMGVVYGDIGTSPLYVMKAILSGNGGLANVSEDFIIGSVSLVIWTLTLMTTIKYVLIALKADNNGEGGILSLFTLVRKVSPFIVFPAMIGGAALLADGVLTPAVTITTAVEGLRGLPFFYDKFGDNQNVIVWITISIVFVLFAIQRFGTEKVGKAFGPIMFGWFTFLGLVGLYNFSGDLSVLRALNPYYAVELLFSPANKVGILILGSVFLATTGAEALYSDMGHVGRENIYASWPYIKICLILNYLGQGAWLISVLENPTYLNNNNLNPFFSMIPQSLSLFSVIFATLAAIIASQSLISGSFTLVSEAIKLRLFPKLQIIYPTHHKGQMYIPALNWALCVMCMLVVFGFKTSHRLEAAYGLAITITMLMTTLLLMSYLNQKNISKWLSYSFFVFFTLLEIVFFISSAAKFLHGGYVAIIIAFVLFAVMWTWYRSNQIKNRANKRVNLTDYMNQLVSLSNDQSVPLYQTNLVYLTDFLTNKEIDRKIIYSILGKNPKRACVYWFVNVHVTDEPYSKKYFVDTMGTKNIVTIQIHLGFRESQNVSIYMKQIVADLIESNLIDKQFQKYAIKDEEIMGGFKYMLLNDGLKGVTDSLTAFEKLVFQFRLWIKSHTSSTKNWFGLQYADVEVETVPLVFSKKRVNYKNIYENRLEMNLTDQFVDSEID